MIKVIDVTLDITQRNQNTSVIKQNNTKSIAFQISILDGGKPFDISDATSATITVKKPDGAISNSNATLNPDGTIYYLLEQNAVNVPGVYEFEAQVLAPNNTMLITTSFFYQVITALANDEGVTSQPQYPILVQLINDVEALESSVTESESVRTTSESARITAETNRIDAELAREANEVARVDNEITRVDNEVERVSNESARQSFYNGYGQIVNISSSTTIISSHRFKVIVVFSASAVNVTVPKDATNNLPIGTQLSVVRKGSGEVTIVAEDANVILMSKDNYKKLDGSYSAATLIKTAANEWVLFGSLKA